MVSSWVTGVQRIERMNRLVENTLLITHEASETDRVFNQLQVIDLQLAILRDFAIHTSLVLTTIFIVLVAWTILKP